jgi:predicted metal-binding membrane protein
MTVEEQMAREGWRGMVYEGNDRLTDRGATRTTAAALTMLGLAAASWVVALRQMDGMAMGVATELGSFGFFVALWVSMMAAMMLPGAVPAVSRFVRVDGRMLAAPLFAGSYLAVWTIVGLVVYALYQPHGALVAGVLTVAAGVYELTPLKRGCRRRCRESVRSGFEFGIYCVGSSIGLMVMLLALGAMSIAWMGIVAAVIFVQKLLAPRAFIDVPFAVAIVVTGIFVAVAPSSIPGLMNTM